jgi:chromosome segregation ATPase
MSQEKYTQHYVEILTATMTDCIVRNVSMQANGKIKDELIEQLNEKILEFKSANDELSKALNELREKNEKNESENIKSLSTQLNSSNSELNDLKSQVALLTKYKVESETLKSQLANSEIFRKELIKERENHESTKKYYEEKIKELNEKIETLETPQKKKKPIKVNKEFGVEESIENIVSLIKDDVRTNQITKDGGIF